MSSTEVFTSHTTVSGKVTMTPEFFDGLNINFAGKYSHGGDNMNKITFRNIPGMPHNHVAFQCDGVNKHNGFKTTDSVWEFLMRDDFTRYEYYGGNKVSSEVNTFLTSKNLKCHYSGKHGNNRNIKIFKLIFPTPFISEPHISCFVTPIQDDLDEHYVTIKPVKITNTVVVFGIQWMTNRNPTEPIYLHWQATGPIASAPTENLLD